MSLHHFGIRVASLDRSIDFYATLGAAPLTEPLKIPGYIYGVPDGTVQMRLLGFPAGTGLELFEFPEPPPPTDSAVPIPHLAIQVPDVDAALARAESAGGGRLWPEPTYWGSVRVIYMRDPDGTVLEILDGTLTTVAAHRPGG